MTALFLTRDGRSFLERRIGEWRRVAALLRKTVLG